MERLHEKNPLRSRASDRASRNTSTTFHVGFVWVPVETTFNLMWLDSIAALAFASPTLPYRCLQVVHSKMASSATLSGMMTENPHFVQCETVVLSAMVKNPF